MTFTATYLEWSRSRHCTTLANVPFPSSWTTMSAGEIRPSGARVMRKGSVSGKRGSIGAGMDYDTRLNLVGDIRATTIASVIETADVSKSSQLQGSGNSHYYTV